QTRALEYSREMRWELVAVKYLRILRDAEEPAKPWAERPILSRIPKPVTEIPFPVLGHLIAMTDSTGLFQHATHDVPNYTEGYCIDDNARALLLITELYEANGHDRGELKRLGSRYLAFVRHAFNSDTGRFRNFMAYDRTWLEDAGSEDSHGRALWALGHLAGRRPETGSGVVASELFRQALPAVRSFTSPRAWAYTLLGIAGALNRFEGDPLLLQECALYTTRLHALLRTNRAADWVWFEDRLSYCNARLPQALLQGASLLNQHGVAAEATESLAWLAELQSGSEGHFEPVGSDRVFVRGSTKPRFDQQPVDVFASLSAYLDARRLSGDRAWTVRAHSAYRWFLGNNHIGQPMYDAESGAGFDGLHSHGINMNRGAESTLSFLHATAAMRQTRATSALAPSQFALVK
ncbi:MAG TPA: hypothetical protein VKT78_08405, partial [Fimbriimonadaceae bacterium]|nr:hypothetical protein [Fimbriimonadaceae bacterium]